MHPSLRQLQVRECGCVAADRAAAYTGRVGVLPFHPAVAGAPIRAILRPACGASALALERRGDEKQHLFQRNPCRNPPSGTLSCRAPMKTNEVPLKKGNFFQRNPCQRNLVLWSMLATATYQYGTVPVRYLPYVPVLVRYKYRYQSTVPVPVRYIPYVPRTSVPRTVRYIPVPVPYGDFTLEPRTVFSVYLMLYSGKNQKR